MVVVQLLAADQDAPGNNVGARVRDIVAAVAEVVANAVDHPGGPERDPGHLCEPYEDARYDAESEGVDAEQHEYSDVGVARVPVALDPVVRRAVAVALERFLVERLRDVEEHAGPEHAVDAVDLRAVRILDRLALGVVLAMDRRPFLG